MGLLGDLIRGGMSPEERSYLEAIERMLKNGEITQQQAEQKRKEWEANLRPIFGEEEAQK